MNKAVLNRNLRKLHLWFGIGIGLQLGLWLISGLFMTIFPIDQVRGTHLRAANSPQIISPNLNVLSPVDIVSNHTLQPQSITLKMLNEQAVYIVTGNNLTQVFDAKTGDVWGVLDEALATQIAVRSYTGRSTKTEASFFQDKVPREYGGEGPVWRIDFKKPDAASFYVDATTAEVKAVRTRLWRTFDFMWGLHIMDWSNRENFNSWWIKTVASLAVLFFLTGLALVLLRIRSTMRTPL